MDSKFARKALDQRFLRLTAASEDLQPPLRGWVRAIRTALDMTATQFARRLGVTPARVAKIEQGEVDGTLTIASLKKAAEALDCSLVYVLIPRHPLTESVNSRARRKAELITKQVNQSMLLEDQAVDSTELQEDRNELASELIRTRSRTLWNEE